MTFDKILEANRSAVPSQWRNKAQWRRDNAAWLGYSQTITLNVLKCMDEQKITQKQLAERMGCSQQYVSNLLKGSSNMTLDTIARLEAALGIDILKSTLSLTNGYRLSSSGRRFLSEPENVNYGRQ